MTTIKRFLTLSLIAALAVQVWAVPAYRGWQTKTQPDGTTVTIRQTGDEFFHYWENEEGQQVAKDAQGFWRVLETPAVQSEVSKQKQASRKYCQRGGNSMIRKAAGQINLAPRGLVILVNYSDVTFRSGNTQAAMSDLMNSENYTYNSATGSVREFFKAQSNGAYVPDFDVVGPYNLANTRAHYGGNDSGGDDLLAGDMIVEACKAADADGVDFTLYNNDGDSNVDFVYVIYAGEGEADSDEDDAIWPHNWTLSSARYYNNCSYSASQSKVDGLSIENYACSGELRGRSTTRCPIGTIAHEFGHVLGLPDYYVTSDKATNAEKDYTPGAWHIMDYGSYNNDGRTPPNYSPHDKLYFGWYSINTSSSKFLAKDAKANGTLTTTYGSWYQITGTTSSATAKSTSRVWYLENRQKSGWDRYLPGHGMVVWEVQYNSSNWTGNTPNNTSVGYTVVTANSLTRPYEPYVDNTTASSTSGTTFPGTSNVTSYTPATGCALTNITESAGNITFKYNGGVVKTRATYEFVTDHCTAPADGDVAINDPLSVTITPASGYTLADASCWDVEMGGVALTYGTDFTYNPATNTFSIASLTDDVVILAEAKPIRTVTWSVNGSTTTIPASTFVDGAALVLPDNPSDCSGVGGKKFVGWTANSSVDGSAPADLFTAAGTKTVTANTTYYAVYATASGSGGSGSTVTLNANTDTSFPKDGITLTTSNGVLNNGTDYRIYKGATLTITSSVGNISSIAFTFDGTYDGGGWETSYTPNASSWTSPACTSGSGGKQARITQIVITVGSGGGGTSYSDYSLLCTTCSNTPTMSFTPATVNKTTSDATFTKVVSMSGNGPGQIAQYSSSDESVATVTNSGVVTLKGKVGSTTITAAVLASGDYCPASASYTLNVTAAPIDVTLYYNGTSANLTNQTNPYTLPTDAPYNTAMCSGDWTFAGWYGSSYAKSTDAPTYITQLTATGSAYAVYTTTETSGGGSGSIITLDANTDTSFPKDGITLSVTDGALDNGSDYRVYKNQTLTITSSVGDMTNIALTYSSASYDGGGWAASYTPNASSWTSPTASGEQARITQIVITVGGGGSSTTYYATTPECVTPCSNTPEMSFTPATVNKTTADATFTQAVTISGKGPGQTVLYSSSDETVATVDNSGVVTLKSKVGSTTITASVAADGDYCAASASYTLNVTAASYTVIWSMNGDESNFESYEEGEAIVFPGTATGCDGKVFRGWSAETVAETDVEPSYITSATMPAHNVTYYAVYAEASGSGGTPSSVSYSFTDKYWHASGGNWTSGQDGAGYNNSGVQVTTGASGANATCPTSYSDISSIVVSYCTNGSSGAGSITMAVGGTSLTNSITKAGGTTARNTTFDFSSTTPDGSPRISVTCTTNSIYICGVTINYGSTTTYTGYTTTCGAGISAQNIGWITTSVSQKVKRVINVSAKNFEDDVTLAASCANSHFAVTLGETAVPAGPSGLTTTLTVEYTPTTQGREENVEIELTAGDKSRTITVSGRCVPDEFLLITKKSSTWYALPANMATSGEHDGIEVSPNDATTPTVVPVSPSNAIYSLASVANSRYEDNGHCVRLVGNSNLCLWSNLAEGATKTNIKNETSVATAATDNHDWLLSTTDGVHYTIANPHHPQYEAGRRLAYGAKFGMYTDATEFFIVSAGCSSQPGEVTVSPRRVEATFSWVSNASSMTIDLYTNDLMTEGHKSATASSSPYIFTGLEESTPYWYKLTPGTDIDCAVTGSFITTGPIVDIVEWQENGVVLYIDKGDITPLIVIDGQEEHGSISGGGGNATELFFAKYFEGAGSMKLVSVFNGTNNDINLSDYSIFVRMRGGSGSWAPGSDVTLDLGTLGSIKAGQEIIFFSRPLDTETDMADCSDDFLTGKVDPSKAYCTSAESNPRWVECGSTLSPYSRINFNGNDPILLLKNTDIIDIIGSQGTAPTATNCNSEKAWAGRVRNMDYGKTVDDPSFAAFYEASSKKPFDTATDDQKKAVLNGFGINLDDEEINITTARCIFFRDKRVLNGDSAVLMNETTGTTFVTFTNHDAFTSEWYGRSVCMTDAMETAAGASGDAQATCNSYQDIANMDYNEYYIDWTNIDPGTALTEFTHDPNTNEYTIDIDNMRQHACLNLRFQLVHEGNVLTEATQQVPIVVVGDVDTNDPLFSELVEDKTTHEKLYPQSLARCADCDVVVLGSASLTKGSDSDPKDVPEVGNVKVYPGGKLVVPTGTNYTMKSLALRRQEDAVASADVQGTITFSAPAPAPARKDVGEKPIRKTPTGTKKTYFDLRVDPTNWHYISLPYDCDVADIRYANPDETDVPVLGTDYLIKWYNGEKRAATQAGGCWEMVAADATLKAGLGYIFSIPGEGSVRREFRFPMDNEVIAQEKADKMVNSVYGYGCDKELTEVRANHRGWNLLGNPYMLPYTTDITTPLETGLIVEDHSTDPWDGHFKFDETSRTNNLRYIVEPINNGWSGYTQVTIEDYPMTPFTSYFVQVGAGDPMDPDPEAPQGINFHVAKVNHSPVRRAPAEYEELEDRHPVWCAVTLTNPKGEKDETTLLISDNFTDGYDMMDDLTKWRGTYYQYAQITTAPVLASRNNEGEMAFNALPDSSALAGVPLNYFAASQGFYTFAYDDKYDRDMEVKEVKLWDKTTNQWYDLMNEPYSFSTARTDNKDRFVLSVRVERKHNQTTTDLENVGTYKGDKPRKLLINGLLYIQRGKDVYDVTGKQLLNR